MTIIREHVHNGKRSSLGYASARIDLATTVFEILAEDDHFARVGRKMYAIDGLEYTEEGKLISADEGMLQVDLDDPQDSYAPLPHDYKYYLKGVENDD